MDSSKVIPLLKSGQPTGEWAVVVPGDSEITTKKVFLNEDIERLNIYCDGEPLCGSNGGYTISILTPSTATPEQKELLAENSLTEFEKVVIIKEIKQ